MGATILLVEDNPANLQLMEYLLRAFGHTTVSTTDGPDGVAAAIRDTPDVILMDLQLPTMDGYEAARQIKAVPSLRDVPIVAVTAFAMVGDRDRVLARGFDGYIGKPIVPDTFVEQVTSHIRGPLSRRDTPASRDAPPRHTILVVDNSPVNLSLARSVFEPSGYDVLTASAAAEGLHIAQRRRPDLILSDVHMPGQSGYDLLRLVRADDGLRATPFVFISSTVWGDAERLSGLAQGADGFILRPIDTAALLAEVARRIAAGREGAQ